MPDNSLHWLHDVRTCSSNRNDVLDGRLVVCNIHEVVHSRGCTVVADFYLAAAFLFSFLTIVLSPWEHLIFYDVCGCGYRRRLNRSRASSDGDGDFFQDRPGNRLRMKNFLQLVQYYLTIKGKVRACQADICLYQPRSRVSTCTCSSC